MIRALLFVLVRSVRGRIVQMLRLLKEPKYLFGFVVGAGWILFWVSRVLISSDMSEWNVQMGPTQEMLDTLAGPLGQLIQVGIALFLATAGAIWWAIPLGRSTLEFNEPELHLLLPAPISRRALIQYGVLKSQPGILVGVAISCVFVAPRSIVAGTATVIATWVFFTLWDLHAKARGLWYARQDELPRAARWRNQILLWVFVFGFLLAAVWFGFDVFWQLAGTSWPDDIDGPEELVRVASQAVGFVWNTPLAWLLTPLIWLTTPIFLGLSRDLNWWWALTALYPVVLLLAHNEWVVRSQSRFEETALSQAKKRSETVKDGMNFWKRTRARRAWAPFTLRETARPEVAILWKNFMLIQRIPLAIAFAVPMALILIVLMMTATGLVSAWVALAVQVIGIAAMVFPTLFGARALRNDLRHDLLHLEIVRTFPLRGQRMFVAQAAAPITLCLLQILFGALVLLGVDAMMEIGILNNPADAKARVAEFFHAGRFTLVPLIVLGYVPIAIAATSLTACLENIAALAFPGWVPLGPESKQAASKFGQYMLVFMALSIAVFAGLLPGALVIGGIVAVQLFFWGLPIYAWELPLLGLAGALPIGAVVFALTAMGGKLWDRLDPSAELLAGRT